MNEEIIAWGGWALETAARVTPLLLLAMAAAALSGKRSAAFRNLIWRGAIAAFVMVGAGLLLLPKWEVISFSKGTKPAPAASLPIRTDRPIGMQPNAETGGETASLASTFQAQPTFIDQSKTLDFRPILPVLWLVGVAMLSARVGVALYRLQRIATTAEPFAQSFSDDSGARPAKLVTHPAVMTPSAWGWPRAVVAFPAAALSWPENRVRLALRHELAHVTRKDFLWNIVAQVVCALFWFHPLAWWANRQMRVEAERACDDAALGERGLCAADYAAELLTLAKGKSQLPSIASTMASELSERIEAILAPDVDRRAPRAATFIMLSAALVTLGFVSACATGRKAAQEETQIPQQPAVVNESGAVELRVVAWMNPLWVPHPIRAISESFDERSAIKVIENEVDAGLRNSGGRIALLREPSLWLHFRSRLTDPESFERVRVMSPTGDLLLDSADRSKAFLVRVQGAHVNQHPMGWTPSDDGLFVVAQLVQVQEPAPRQAVVVLEYAIGDWEWSDPFEPRNFPAPHIWGVVDQLNEIQTDDGVRTSLTLRAPDSGTQRFQINAELITKNGKRLQPIESAGHGGTRELIFQTPESNVASIRLRRRPLRTARYETTLPPFDSKPGEAQQNKTLQSKLVGTWLAANWSEGLYNLEANGFYRAEFGKDQPVESGRWFVERQKVKFETATRSYDRPIVQLQPSLFIWREGEGSTNRQVSFRKVITAPARTLTPEEEKFVGVWVSRRGFIPGQIVLKADATWESGTTLGWPPQASGAWSVRDGQLRLTTHSSHHADEIGVEQKYVFEKTGEYELIRREEFLGGIGYYRSKQSPN
ncbi:MAG TPA: M56 family metallopeptidase [Methylomirabilota bacterium]|nr:M56 family metallopeptidase [Methylomirabilota bacterium]